MIVENIITDFYNKIIDQYCVIFVNYDVDAICACKILQFLLRCDNILYTIVPTRSINDIREAFRENNEVKYFIFINCGATIDLVEELEPTENDVNFFIIDSHRPVDVCNIYNDQMVYIVNPGNLDDVPAFDDIFQESEDENEEDENESGEDDSEDAVESRVAKRQRLNHEKALKRRQKRQWEEKRDKLMFEYTQFGYYGRSSAILLYELTWKLSKDSLDTLWWAIVGLTEQIILNKIETQQYVIECGNLQNHVSRLNRVSSISNEPSNSTNDEQTIKAQLKIVFENDLKLALYRHWSVEQSLKNSVYTACKLRLWTLRGEKRLHELLAEMGLPIVQSKQNFSSMDLVLRKEFHESLERLSNKYGLNDLIFGSFTLHYGFKNKFSASDIVYAMISLLENPLVDKLNDDNHFTFASDCLLRSKKSILDMGIQNAKKLLTIITRQVQCSLDMGQVASAGPFLYSVIKEGTVDCHIYSQPHCLLLFAQFILRAYVAVSKSKKSTGLPLICSAPHHSDKEQCIVLGIPPLSEDSPKNFFGKAFTQAAINSKSKILLEYFESSIVHIYVKDRGMFFDALTTLLS